MIEETDLISLKKELNSELEEARLKNHNLDLLLIVLRAHDCVKKLYKEGYKDIYFSYFGNGVIVYSGYSSNYYRNRNCLWSSSTDSIELLNIEELKKRAFSEY